LETPFQSTQKNTVILSPDVMSLGQEEMDAKKKAILDYAWLFARRKSSARSFSLFIPAWYGCGVLVLLAWDKKGSG
jgi:hypothetical protein